MYKAIGSSIAEGLENYLYLTKNNPEQNVLEFFTQIQEKDELTRNYWLFLKELATPVLGKLVPTVNYFENFPRCFVPNLAESNWSCHTTAPWYSELEPHLECYFGFVDVYYEGVYEKTNCHSFIVSNTQEIVDIQYNFQVRDFEDLQKSLRNYYGVHIPKSIIKEIFEREPENVKANLGGFFKFEVFQSSDLTLHWIQKIKEARAAT